MTPGIYASSIYGTPALISHSKHGPGSMILPAEASTTTSTAPVPPSVIKDTHRLSLDAFQARYTSEDNASFAEIIERQNEAQRQRYQWAYDEEKRQRALDAPKAVSNALPPAVLPLMLTDGMSTATGALVKKDNHKHSDDDDEPTGFTSTATSNAQDNRVNRWRFTAKNPLIWNPEAVGSQITDGDGDVRGPPKSIAHGATRFPKKFKVGYAV